MGPLNVVLESRSTTSAVRSRAGDRSVSHKPTSGTQHSNLVSTFPTSVCHSRIGKVDSGSPGVRTARFDLPCVGSLCFTAFYLSLLCCEAQPP